MTDNMKKFLEEASKDKEYLEKLTKAETPEAMMALAKEKGYALTAEDMKSDQSSGKLSDDEVDAVAGGKACACVVGGGGLEGKTFDDECGCVGVGLGYRKNTSEELRCFCSTYGGGESFEH